MLGSVDALEVATQYVSDDVAIELGRRKRLLVEERGVDQLVAQQGQGRLSECPRPDGRLGSAKLVERAGHVRQVVEHEVHLGIQDVWRADAHYRLLCQRLVVVAPICIM